MRSLRLVGYLVATGYLVNAMALSTIPQPRAGSVLVVKDGERAFGHCVQLGGRVYHDNLCLLGGR